MAMTVLCIYAMSGAKYYIYEAIYIYSIMYSIYVCSIIYKPVVFIPSSSMADGFIWLNYLHEQ